MEFKVYQKELELQSRGWIPTFHDVSKEVIEIVKASGIKNGTVCLASHHTTCSVMIQECSHDIDSFDLEYLQHDLLDIMRKMIPESRTVRQIRKRAGRLHITEHRRSPSLRILRQKRNNDNQGRRS